MKQMRDRKDYGWRSRCRSWRRLWSFNRRWPRRRDDRRRRGWVLGGRINTGLPGPNGLEYVDRNKDYMFLLNGTFCCMGPDFFFLS